MIAAITEWWIGGCAAFALAGAFFSPPATPSPASCDL